MVDDDSVDFLNPDAYEHGVPHHAFSKLRQTDPVAELIAGDGQRYWAVTTHAAVCSVLKEHRKYSSSLGGALVIDPPPPLLQKLRQHMLHQDPPEHTTSRRLFSAVFSPKSIANLEVRVMAHLNHLLDSTSNGEFDFAGDIAGALPLRVISDLLGVPREDADSLFVLTRQTLATAERSAADALQTKARALEGIREYGRGLTALRRKQPQEDLISSLLLAEVGGRRLTDDEIGATFQLLFSAGADTTRSLLCFLMATLIERPDLYDALRTRPASIPAAIEESLRFDSPIISVRRTAVRDTELCGKQIRKGDKVVCFLVSANRDGRVFAEPDEFLLTRNPNPHVAFGFGVHFCLGAAVGRLNARLTTEALLKRCRRIESRGEIILERTNFVRGVARMPVAFIVN